MLTHFWKLERKQVEEWIAELRKQSLSLAKEDENKRHAHLPCRKAQELEASGTTEGGGEEE